MKIGLQTKLNDGCEFKSYLIQLFYLLIIFDNFAN